MVQIITLSPENQPVNKESGLDTTASYDKAR